MREMIPDITQHGEEAVQLLVFQTGKSAAKLGMTEARFTYTIDTTHDAAQTIEEIKKQLAEIYRSIAPIEDDLMYIPIAYLNSLWENPVTAQNIDEPMIEEVANSIRELAECMPDGCMIVHAILTFKTSRQINEPAHLRG
jgi:acetylornithine deacetylase/succinyl-diaminopimelate desuccinylase-like protein